MGLCFNLVLLFLALITYFAAFALAVAKRCVYAFSRNNQALAHTHEYAHAHTATNWFRFEGEQISNTFINKIDKWQEQCAVCLCSPHIHRVCFAYTRIEERTKWEWEIRWRATPLLWSFMLLMQCQLNDDNNFTNAKLDCVNWWCRVWFGVYGQNTNNTSERVKESDDENLFYSYSVEEKKNKQASSKAPSHKPNT